MISYSGKSASLCWNRPWSLEWLRNVNVKSMLFDKNYQPEALLQNFCQLSSILAWILFSNPGPWFNIKMSSYRYRKSHCGDKMVVRSSYLHNGISYIGKMTSLYWIRAQALGLSSNWVHCIKRMRGLTLPEVKLYFMLGYPYQGKYWILRNPGPHWPRIITINTWKSELSHKISLDN